MSTKWDRSTDWPSNGHIVESTAQSVTGWSPSISVRMAIWPGAIARRMNISRFAVWRTKRVGGAGGAAAIPSDIIIPLSCLIWLVKYISYHLRFLGWRFSKMAYTIKKRPLHTRVSSPFQSSALPILHYYTNISVVGIVFCWFRRTKSLIDPRLGRYVPWIAKYQLEPTLSHLFSYGSL